jgi:hypothetical protein
MAESLKPLLDLQEVDLARDRLNERLAKLPEKLDLAERERRMDEIRAAIAAVDAEIEGVVKEMDRLDDEVRALDDKIGREESKLYGGSVSNPKELSALQSEIEMLKRRKAPLEEAEIETMVARDERYEERERLRAELADVEGEARVLRERIADATADIEKQLAEELGRREEYVGTLPEDIVELYESLRDSKRGVGVGALSGGVCTACRETLSAVEQDRIRQAAKAGETRFRCEHCRRILVVT